MQITSAYWNKKKQPTALQWSLTEVVTIETWIHTS